MFVRASSGGKGMKQKKQQKEKKKKYKQPKKKKKTQPKNKKLIGSRLVPGRQEGNEVG